MITLCNELFFVGVVVRVKRNAFLRGEPFLCLLM